MTQRVNDCLDFRLRHSVRSFVCCTGCHSTPIAGNVAVRTQVQVCVEQQSIHPLQRQSFGTAFADDSEDSLSVAHLAHLHFLLSKTPAPLRHAVGFPDLGLLRGLRPHGARAL